MNVKWKCVGCGLTMEAPQGNGQYPKDNHPYFNDLCPKPKPPGSGSVYRDRKYHQWMRDYSK